MMTNQVTYYDPQLTILVGAFLALAVFVGGLAAGMVVNWLRSCRERRLLRLHAPKN